MNGIDLLIQGLQSASLPANCVCRQTLAQRIDIYMKRAEIVRSLIDQSGQQRAAPESPSAPPAVGTDIGSMHMCVVCLDRDIGSWHRNAVCACVCDASLIRHGDARLRPFGPVLPVRRRHHEAGLALRHMQAGHQGDKAHLHIIASIPLACDDNAGSRTSADATVTPGVQICFDLFLATILA